MKRSLASVLWLAALVPAHAQTTDDRACQILSRMAPNWVRLYQVYPEAHTEQAIGIMSMLVDKDFDDFEQTVFRKLAEWADQHRGVSAEDAPRAFMSDCLADPRWRQEGFGRCE